MKNLLDFFLQLKTLTFMLLKINYFNFKITKKHHKDTI